MSKETAEILRKARDLIVDHGKHPLDTVDRICGGARADARTDARRVLSHAAITLYGADASVSAVNDVRGHAAVLRLFDHAIANAEAQS